MAKKLRIMYVVQSLVKGGAERLVLEICNEIIRRDDVEAIIVGHDKRNDYSLLAENVKFVYVPVEYKLSLIKRNRVDVSSLNDIIMEFKPHVIHTHCYMQEAPVREQLKENISYFTHLHDNMPAFRNLRFSEIFIRKRLGEYYEKRKLIKKYKKCKNTFLAISMDTFNYFKENLPSTLASNIILMPNAINYNRFCYDQKRIINRQRPIRLINIGHFAPKKNQVFLLKVLKALKDKGVTVHLKFIGDCENLKEVFMGEAKLMGVAENLELTGLVENVENHLRDADIYVHSATYEPFGLVLLEAMAASLPVVCLDAGGNRDVMREGENGFIINGEDAIKYADTIIKLIDDRVLYSRISLFASEFPKAYDIKNYVDKLLELYILRLQR